MLRNKIRILLILFVLVLCAFPAFSATHTVTNCADSGPGSLRQAILDANADGAAAPLIDFNITIANAGYSTGEGYRGVVTTEAGSNKWFRIIVTDPGLPAITHSQVYIDGTSQPVGEVNNTLGPEIEIRKTLTPSSPDYAGLRINTSSCTIEGLVINGFNVLHWGGIRLEGDYNRIIGCYLGTSATGEAAWANSMGVGLRNYCDHNIIGGSTLAERNIISGNTYGVYLHYSECSSNEVKGNYIGLTPTSAALKNAQGVHFEYPGHDNVIGGDSTSDRNYISSNDYGIYLEQAHHAQIKNNYIGLNTYEGIRGNNYGIYLVNGTNNVLIKNNLISGNNVTSGSAGIMFDQSGSDNLVIGNKIGTNSTGTGTISNYYGIILQYSSNSNVIGGTTEAERNIISGNQVRGIYIINSSSNEVKGNYIGLYSNGDAAGNSEEGVYVLNASSFDTVIGGVSTFERNYICSNNYGIYISSVPYVQIENNYIGIGLDGSALRGNTMHGIYLGSSDHATVESNVISGNSSGIHMYISDHGNIIANKIGTDADGNAPKANSNGIFLNSGSYNVIGSIGAGRNIISGNGNQGIYILNSLTNEVRGNYIGIYSNGSAGGNGANGVSLNSSDINTIESNVISGQSGTGDCGLYLNSSDRNHIIGNKIGTNASGASSIANQYGIYLENACANNIIGGSTEAERNIISGNSSTDIYITGSTTNEVKGNYIGPNITGNTGLSSTTGIQITSFSHDNVIGGSVSGEGNLISGHSGAYGIYIYDYCDGNKVLGNRVGTRADGEAALPNYLGIMLGDGSANEDNNIIGGTLEAERNLISGNSRKGIQVQMAGGDNYIIGNYVGLSASGEGSVPNQEEGIFLNTPYNPIYLYDNNIQYNVSYGLWVRTFDGNTSFECIGNTIKNNYSYGIWVSQLTRDHQLVFTNGTLEANSTGPSDDVAVYNETGHIADFQYNDWGYPTGPYDPDDKTAEGRWYNPVGQGQEVTDYVDYRYFAGWGSVTPEAPTGFAGETLSATSIKWSWDDNTTWESGYHVLAYPSGDVVATVGRGITSVEEIGLTPDTLYTREAVAFKIDTSSEASGTFSAKTIALVGPSIIIISPNGGEIWKSEDPHPIQFSVSDPDGVSPESASIYYSIDGGTTYTNVIGTSLPTDEACDWTPGTIETTEARVSVTAMDVFDNPGTGESASNFILDARDPSARIIEMYYGMVINAADGPYLISWEASDTLGLATNPITLRYSTNAGSSWSVIVSNEANSGVYSWTLPEVNSENAYISIEAVDIAGRKGCGLSPRFTMKGVTEEVAPEVEIHADGTQLISGDYISRRPVFKAVISDKYGLDHSTLKMYLDGVARTFTYLSSTDSTAEIQYIQTSDLDDESVMTHNLIVSVYDLTGNFTSKEVKELKVSYSEAKIVGEALVYPQPARFRRSGGAASAKDAPAVKIAYSLTADSDVTLYVIGDKVLKTIKYPSGSMGAKAGYNEVEWDGYTDFGALIGNGIYPVKVVVNGKVVGTAYLVVAD